ncbi:MAG: DNA/RNA nuclease SfsA [Holosporaceae bacterium]|jgi:sugar fermentation stimulation protein A|nr:DNA/RNA nuclease SfsA [Holosporaceae bacterium]
MLDDSLRETSNIDEKLCYKFTRPLEFGKIVARPNRFIMHVEKDGNIFVCHCPSTGKIGNVIFSDVPCLLSKSLDPRRKTAYTVEAIALNNFWIGINQNAVNRYVEHFFRSGLLENIAKNGHKILREQKIGDSKLDFKIENTYLEVKMPLQFLAFNEGDRPSGMKCVSSHERFVRHITELKNRLQEHENAILLSCFVYDAPIFTPPERSERNKMIFDIVQQSLKAGVRIWQINLGIDPYGIKLLRYFDITDYLFKN